MRFDGCGKVAATRLTKTDLSDEEAVKDARFELHNCHTDAQFAAWARRWGEPSLLIAEGFISATDGRAQRDAQRGQF